MNITDTKYTMCILYTMKADLKITKFGVLITGDTKSYYISYLCFKKSNFW